jgi:hypothetical protein
MGVKTIPLTATCDTRKVKEEGNTKRRDKGKKMCLQFEGNREKGKVKVKARW